VRVGLGKRAAVVVPESALVRRGQLDGVFVEAEGKLAFRIVQAGPAAGAGRREILSGLVAGERVVVEGTDRASDGARVAEGDR
jgi:multidrug efflux pump subunit AcrA (membrane-fusion protein)